MSGSNIQEEVPEEEIDEDYEDEKEEDSGMGAMIAGGAGLLVVVAAVVFILVCACGGCGEAEKPAVAQPPEQKPVAGNPPAGETPPEVVQAPPQTSKESVSNSPKSASTNMSTGSKRSRRASGANPKTFGSAVVGGLMFIAGLLYMFLPGSMPGGAKMAGALGGSFVTPAHILTGVGAICCLATGGLTAFKAKGPDGDEADKQEEGTADAAAVKTE